MGGRTRAGGPECETGKLGINSSGSMSRALLYRWNFQISLYARENCDFQPFTRRRKSDGHLVSDGHNLTIQARMAELFCRHVPLIPYSNPTNPCPRWIAESPVPRRSTRAPTKAFREPKMAVQDSDRTRIAPKLDEMI